MFVGVDYRVFSKDPGALRLPSQTFEPLRGFIKWSESVLSGVGECFDRLSNLVFEVLECGWMNTTNIK